MPERAIIRLGDTLNGVCGTAVECLIDSVPVRDMEATLATWFLTCPLQSPAWDKYLLCTIHLRAIPGARPATVRYPGMTHEVLLLALNPEKNPVPTDNETWHFLTPVNFCDQVELPDDAAAVLLLRQCAQAVVDGWLWAEPPLSGQKEPWRTVLIKTAAHHRGEEHAP